jgi:hypothetical protein
MNIFLPIAGVLTLLYNGYVFSNWATATPIGQFAAVVTTVAWLYLFISAYTRAYRP